MARGRKQKIFTPEGFYLPPEDDPRQAKDYFRIILHTLYYMPGQQKQAVTPEWNKARVTVNLTVVFEAICYFGDFWGHGDGFWQRLVTCLDYPGKQHRILQSLTEVYCDARLEFLNQQQGQDGPAPSSRLTELADNINGIRKRESKHALVNWALLMDGWRDRLKVILGELEAISVPADRKPKAKRSSSSDGKSLSSSSKENPLFFFDISGCKCEISGKKRTASDDATFGNLPKRLALENDASKKVQKRDLETKESTASLEQLQTQLNAIQDQLWVHQLALHARASPTTPAPALDSKGHDLSEMLAYQPHDFIQAICEELGKLRAVTKSKIHQMDKQGLPDDEKKLAVSDLSWQIGKCIKVAEKGVGELM